MSRQAQDTSVRAQVVVDAPIGRAFATFTEGIGGWWPPEYNLLGVEIAERVFEPREAGQVYDIGVDGSECHWGRVLAYEPPDRVVFSWDISPQWQIETDAERTSEVEVRFISESLTARASRSSTATSSGMARAGKGSAARSTPRAAGPAACSDSPSTSRWPESHWRPRRRALSADGDAERPAHRGTRRIGQPQREAECPGGRRRADDAHERTGRVSWMSDMPGGIGGRSAPSGRAACRRCRRSTGSRSCRR